MITETTVNARNARNARRRAAIERSAEGRARLIAGEGSPLFVSDWDRAVFLHYAVPPDVLQPFVPFPLETWDGMAYVSLVAFTLRDLRPRVGGRVTRFLWKPVATHEFLNVRTYVRVAGESGIYFLAEWLPNRASVFLGPRLFGLPYRLGRHEYRHDHERRSIEGSVAARDTAGSLRYRLCPESDLGFRPVESGTLDEFLLERYTAFTERKGTRRLFRIWHPPWPAMRFGARVEDRGLLAATGTWWTSARFAGAHYSPGVRGVWIGRAQRLRDGARSREA